MSSYMTVVYLKGWKGNEVSQGREDEVSQKGLEVNFVGKPWEMTWNLCLRGTLPVYQKKKLMNFFSQIPSAIAWGLLAGVCVGGGVVNGNSDTYHPKLGQNILPRKASSQEVHILGRRRLQVGMGWVSVCLFPTFSFNRGRKKEGGEREMK